MDTRFEISVGELEPGCPLPGLIEAAPGAELSAFASKHRSAIRAALLEYGGLLFRGFGVTEASQFEDFTLALDLPLMEYPRGMTPRTRVQGRVFTSTDTRPDFPIPLHTEMSYAHIHPQGLVFSCTTPATEGGATPLVDLRRVLARIPEAAVAELERRGLQYIQIVPLEPTAILTRTWPDMFGTRDHSEVERIAAKQHNECSWLEDGSLRLLARMPAFRRHPKTGERVWFNQAAVWCGSMSEELAELAEAGEEPDAPDPNGTPGLDASKTLDCRYGDGGALPADVIGDVRRNLRELTASFPWQRGDLMLIDNLRVGHGRTTYQGERRVLAALVSELWHE
ncbi:MAG: TauD/TfdA family dioxygenase [Deltaproteobacteria bacterium]|nr:TauD/TfdA family dioxygenase [Deltaproteobacteria bacterium]MBW2361258.1 TauD/TfdA family dioxygenase [Deltaproteobacteria bacterium]